MKVLVVGSGGREHALVWKIAQSPLVDALFAAPGNAGMAAQAQCVNIGVEDSDRLVAFARWEGIDLTVVGPEVPLVLGIVDRFQEAGLCIFGPNREAAQLEGSKVFAKELLRQARIPTAEFRVFDDPSAAHEYLDSQGAPIVVKADGLAAGKGALVCRSIDEAHEAVEDVMVKKQFGQAGRQVVIEECLVGEEVSMLALTDGRSLYLMPPSQDHKAIYDGDQGPNTGGMGAYSPVPAVSREVEDRVVREVFVPLLHGLRVRGIHYSGVVYAGLMLTAGGPKVLEFNCRFGDPETQPMLLRLKSDLVPVLEAVIDGRLAQASFQWDERASVCVVMASGGYPGSYEKGKPISGLAEAGRMKDVVVFHAGTASVDGQVVTNGGRVLGVTALGGSIAAAKARAYEAVRKIQFEGAYYRTDIADRAIRRAGR
jgi:phosphoribosylamine--glycine ligase